MNVDAQRGELLNALKAGKSAAFERLYRDNYPMVAKLILNNNGKLTDAQDVFQETLIAFVKNLNKPDFELKAKVSTYLYSIAHRIWLYKIRQHKPTASLVVEGKDIDVIDTGGSEVEAKQKYEEKHILMAKVLKELKEDCQQLLTGYYFKKQSLQELAELMEYTYAFIKVKKNRCMNGFKKKIEANPQYQQLIN